MLSGRRDGKPLVEDCLTLGIARLMRLGPICDGMAGHSVLDWSIDGQSIGTVHFRLDLRDAAAARLVLGRDILRGAERLRDALGRLGRCRKRRVGDRQHQNERAALLDG
jgi:hypothetical protein